MHLAAAAAAAKEAHQRSTCVCHFYEGILAATGNGPERKRKRMRMNRRGGTAIDNNKADAADGRQRQRGRM